MAQFSAALETCKKLREIQELDENMMPLGRDNSSHYKRQQQPAITVNPSNEQAAAPTTTPVTATTKDQNQAPTTTPTSNSGRPGTTKRRQYYYKQVSNALSNCAKDQVSKYSLYAFKMRLTCALPDEQNTRGRKIHAPENSALSFGILVQTSMPPICQFPIYTRDGEIFVETSLIDDDVQLNDEQREQVVSFHKYTFSRVLRLEKYPMIFKPNDANSQVIVVPLSNARNQAIDWHFLSTLDYDRCVKLNNVSDEDRAAKLFEDADYEDAVVSPWYRNQDQPQFFYVAEICTHLSPRSDFPGQGFDTFEKYYRDKYKINIQHLDQPLLDVDHTSARLNFLTPRYVNRKGMSLPTSSEETKRSKRENLEQKQILVPELCAIHPFPASLWRQAVCLPCVLYRLNCLLVADSLRRLVASEMKLGIIDLGKGHQWPPLNFGWTLSDVIQSGLCVTNKKQEALQQASTLQNSDTNETSDGGENAEENSRRPSSPLLIDGEEELSNLSCKLMNKLNQQESKLREKSNLEIGTWSNEMAQFEKKSSNSKSSEPTDEEDFEEMMDPNIALPDNLTFLDDSVLPQVNPGGDRRDWGTGIAQKKFRVGSPTFFSNPNINIPGLLDDLDGFSCSDSEEEEEFTFNKKLDIDEVEDVGNNVRIEFRGRNLAEAIEDEELTKTRLATLAKNQQEEQTMVQDLPWDHLPTNDDTANFDKDWIVVGAQDEFSRENRGHSCSTIAKSPNLYSLPGFDFSLAEVIKSRENCGVLPRTDDILPSFSFDLQPNLQDTCGPSPSLLLQALTMSNSNDVINLGNWENCIREGAQFKSFLCHLLQKD